jgi:putative nucleotidyltransferase with HDIG domain
MEALDRIIHQAGKLPPAPRILPELLALLRQQDVDTHAVVRLIMLDPALTAQVLRRCNSARRGLAAPVGDLPNAVLQIGFGEVYRVVAAIVGERTLGAPQPGYGIAQGELWKHCAVAAVAARLIARDLGADDPLVFTAALLHDLGKLVLTTALEAAYAEVIAKTEGERLSLLEAEKAILGVDHAEIGGQLLSRWNFPETLVQAVWRHHDPLRAGHAEQLAAFVHLGDVLAHWLGHGYGHQAYALRCRAEALDILEVTYKDLEQFLIQTADSVEEVLALNAA